MPNFKLYSAYYDLLYQEKDYKSEAAYVDEHLKKHLPGATQLLELGCGTGNHARYLSEYGYEITGIERSGEMLEQAKKKSIIHFNPVLANIADFKLSHSFDAAICLFHSLCYTTRNDQLLASFKNISHHLRAGGVFAFDFWYGPAVLHHLPVSRTKCQQNEYIDVIRKSETTMYIDNNIAEVNYEILVYDKKDGRRISFNEKHPMRYFSLPEIDLIAAQTGFTIIGFEEFLTARQPALDSWNMFVVLQKTGNA